LGGIVGSNFFSKTANSNVDKCEASGIVRGDMDDKTFAGGIVGFNFAESSVTNCKADNAASGKTAGGVVGFNYGRVADCSFDEGRYASKISHVGSQPILKSMIVKGIKNLAMVAEDEKSRAEALKYAPFALITVLAGIASLVAYRAKNGKKNHGN
jgi:hypothetical protein